MRTRWLFVLPLLAAFAGCYHYVPVETMAYPRGTPVRAYLDSLSSFELSAITVNNVNRVDGEMVQVDQGDVVLSATWLQAVTGSGFQGSGWTVRIPQGNVTGFERRQISWLRTGLVLGGLAAATVFGFDALGVSQNPGTGGGGGTDIN